MRMSRCGQVDTWTCVHVHTWTCPTYVKRVVRREHHSCALSSMVRWGVAAPPFHTKCVFSVTAATLFFRGSELSSVVRSGRCVSKLGSDQIFRNLAKHTSGGRKDPENAPIHGSVGVPGVLRVFFDPFWYPSAPRNAYPRYAGRVPRNALRWFPNESAPFLHAIVHGALGGAFSLVPTARRFSCFGEHQMCELLCVSSVGSSVCFFEAQVFKTRGILLTSLHFRLPGGSDPWCARVFRVFLKL